MDFNRNFMDSGITVSALKYGSMGVNGSNSESQGYTGIARDQGIKIIVILGPKTRLLAIESGISRYLVISLEYPIKWWAVL